MSDVGDEFWRFTLAYYARPGVSEACIALQDEHGFDVNLVLFCLWVGWSGRGRLSDAALADAETAARPWRTGVVVPLRSVRRVLKGSPVPGAEALRERVKAAELEGERLQHGILAALAPARGPGRDQIGDAAANLGAYIEKQLPEVERLVAALRELRSAP
jgi:uncharacterized protein (TIGR02444 family)